MASDFQNRSSTAAKPIPAPQTQVAPRKEAPASSSGAAKAASGRSFKDALKDDAGAKEPSDAKKAPASRPDRPDRKGAAEDGAPAKLKGAEKPAKIESSSPAKAAAAGDEAGAAKAAMRDDSVVSEELAQKNAARKALQPLRQAVAANKMAVETSPVVAFLTGHLEHIDPASIPALLTGNEFLQGALSESDVGAFMGQPVAIEDLLEALDLPPELLGQAALLGLDGAQAISPQEIMKALGVDPNRVTSELNLLKDNMTSNGVASYMQRAMVAGAAMGVGTSGEMRSKLLGDDRLETPAWAKGGAPIVPGAAQSPFGAAAMAGVTPAAGGGPGMPNSKLANTGSPRDVLASGKQSGAVPGPDAGALAMPTAGTAAMPSTLALPTDMLSRLAGDGMPPADALTLPRGSELPNAKATSVDPFAALDATMRGLDVTSIPAGFVTGLPKAQTAPQMDITPPLPSDAAPTLNAASGLLEEALLRANMANGLDLLKMPTAAMPALATVVAEPSVRVDEMPKNDARAVRTDFLDSLRAAPVMTAQTFAAPSAAASVVPTKSLAVSADELRLAAPLSAMAVTMGSERSGESPARDSESQNSNRDSRSGLDAFAREFSDSAANLQGAASGLAAHGALDFGSAVAGAPREAGIEQLTPQQRADMVQKLMDGATMMVKAGGGSMRLDLGSPELGAIELAVDMKDNRVDLKILTGNDRVRDAMTAELSRLRDALAVQNVQLGNVDVGVSQRQAGESFASFSQNQGQSQQGERELRQLREEINTAAARSSMRPAGISGVDGIRSVSGMEALRRMTNAGASTSGRLEVRA